MKPTNTRLVMPDVPHLALSLTPAFKTHRRNLIEESHLKFLASQCEETRQYCDETLTEQEKEFCGIV